jgi:hypothetical protein
MGCKGNKPCAQWWWYEDKTRFGGPLSTWLLRRSQGGREEVPQGTSTVEGIENEDKYTPLNLGSRYKGSGGNELKSTLHQVHVSLGCELHPIDKTAISALGHGDKREEPVPQKEPVTVKIVDNVKDRGIA